MWKVPEEQERAKLPCWLWAVTGMAGEKEGESVWIFFLASKMLQNNANSLCSMIQIWKKLSLQKQQQSPFLYLTVVSVSNYFFFYFSAFSLEMLRKGVLASRVNRKARV